MSGLTGRTRYRVTWWGTLVLQVEAYVHRPGVICFDPWVETEWRDARCEDFNVFGDLFAKAPIPYPGQKPVTDQPASPDLEFP